jgi:hypothetical protein
MLSGSLHGDFKKDSPVKCSENVSRQREVHKCFGLAYELSKSFNPFRRATSDFKV